MLFFLACLVGQFAPGATSPTVDEYRARRVAEYRSHADSLKPDKKLITKQSRAKTSAAMKASVAVTAEADYAEKNKGYLPPGTFLANNPNVGEIGIPFQREVTPGTQRIAGRIVDNTRTETVPAEFKVNQTLSKTELICQCRNKEFVLRGYTGPAVADGAKFKPDGIYIVSGVYRIDGESLTVIEPWIHNAEWNALPRRPEAPAKKK